MLPTELSRQKQKIKIHHIAMKSELNLAMLAYGILSDAKTNDNSEKNVTEMYNWGKICKDMFDFYIHKNIYTNRVIFEQNHYCTYLISCM